MNRIHSAMVPVFLLLAACSDPGPEPATEPEPSDEAATAAPPPAATGGAAGVDPAVADPDHYTAEFENDSVRILRIRYGAGEESVMHSHPGSVAVFLTDVLVQMRVRDGTTSDISAPAGTAVFEPAVEHQPKNIGDSGWEVVEVELKPQAPAQGPAGGPDPTVVDPDHYAVELENEAARVLRITYGPGEESVMHYHPDSVAVFLNDHHAQMTMPDGSTSEIEAAAGDAMFIPAGQHLPKSLSESDVELLLIELK